MYRRVGKVDLMALFRRSSDIQNYKNCSIIQNRHYQCGEQGVYGFRNKQAVPFKCECCLFIFILIIELWSQWKFFSSF